MEILSHRKGIGSDSSLTSCNRFILLGIGLCTLILNTYKYYIRMSSIIRPRTKPRKVKKYNTKVKKTIHKLEREEHDKLQVHIDYCTDITVKLCGF